MKPGWRWRLLDFGLIIALASATVAQSFGVIQVQKSTDAKSAQPGRALGTIKSVHGNSLTVSPDSGGEINVTLTQATKIVCVSPGQADLKNALALQVGDLRPGDRVLVRGPASTDGGGISALAVIVMKQADVSAKQERDREDWQKRGVAGLVDSVDPPAGTINVSVGGFSAAGKVLVRTTPTTIARRYAPNSVRFDDAKPAPLDQVKPGDQLRARGPSTVDGGEMTAEEIVSGTFRNIAGNISAIDVANNWLTVQDAIAKSSVTVKISADSQMKKLPAEMAQRIAARLKASNGAGGEGANRAPSAGVPSNRTATGPSSAGNGPPDFQRFLSRIPGSSLSDLRKGDAVMIVSTVAQDSGPVTAITLLAGVEPILTANSNRSASVLLSPWTLGGSSGESEAAP